MTNFVCKDLAMEAPLSAPESMVLVPGLNCSARLYAEQIPALWRFGSVLVADHRHDDQLGALAGRILSTAPPQFALVGLSMGGYIAFEMCRQAPDRITRLALLDTSARADRPDQTERRRQHVALAESGEFAQIPDLQFPTLVHPGRHNDAALRAVVHMMAEDTGAASFVRQQKAIAGRPDSRNDLARIGCPTLVMVGDRDELTPPELAREIADGIAGSRLIVVPRCGHLSTLECPLAVTEALIEWLSV